MGIPWEWECVSFVHGNANENGNVGMGGNGNKPYGHYASRRRSGKNSRCYN